MKKSILKIYFWFTIFLFLLFTNSFAASKTIDFEENANLYEAIKSELARQSVSYIYYDNLLEITLDTDDVTSLVLKEKNIKDIKQIQEFTILNDLTLTDNNISDITYLSGLNNLKWVSLDSNNISDLTPLAGSKDTIIFLELSNNQIDDISIFSDFQNLNWLSVDGNKVSNIKPIENLINLETIYMSNNDITDISYLEKLIKLKNLYLDNNNVNNIDVLSNMNNLEYLSLHGNDISDISSISNSKASLISLELSSNDITDIEVLSDFTKLNWLSLDDNKISNIDSLKKLNSLEKLYLSGNSISDLNPISSLKNLTFLSADRNDIEDISPINKLENLKELSLYKNKIKNIDALSNLQDTLTWLELSYNNIENIDVIEYLPKLTWLSMVNNKISDLSMITSAENFEYIDFNYQELEEDVLITVESLELKQIFKDKNLKIETFGNVEANLNENNIEFKNALAGDKVVLTIIADGQLTTGSVITYDFLPIVSKTASLEVLTNKESLQYKVDETLKAELETEKEIELDGNKKILYINYNCNIDDVIGIEITKYDEILEYIVDIPVVNPLETEILGNIKIPVPDSFDISNIEIIKDSKKIEFEIKDGYLILEISLVLNENNRYITNFFVLNKIEKDIIDSEINEDIENENTIIEEDVNLKDTVVNNTDEIKNEISNILVEENESYPNEQSVPKTSDNIFKIILILFMSVILLVSSNYLKKTK